WRVVWGALALCLAGCISGVAASRGETASGTDNHNIVSAAVTKNMSLGDGGVFLLTSDSNMEAAGNPPNQSEFQGNTTAPFTMPQYIVVWVSAANLLVFLAGVLGNALVIVVVLCAREMKTATNLCLMNLSVADLLVLLFCQPSAMLEFIYEEQWLLGQVMCKLTIFLENTVIVTSILIIVTVSLERFWAVYYPLKTYSSGSKSRAMIIMAGVWLTSALVTVPYLVMADTVETTRHTDNALVEVCITGPTSSWVKAYIVARFTFIFAVPMVLLAALYTMIIHKVLTETMECKQMTESARSQSAQNRRQLVIMLVGIIVLFFLCLLPFRILALVLTFATYDLPLEMGHESFLNLLYFCRLLIYINSAGNPIIYNIFSTKFRRAFQKVLRLYCCCCKKRLVVGVRHPSNGAHLGTRMTTMSQSTHYSMVRPEASDSVDNV
ncbi:hypothetical protein EGW08_008825, partial [Elysia chlorotica]